MTADDIGGGVRCASVEEIESVLNRPEVLPHFLPPGADPADAFISMERFYSRPGNVAYICDGAVMLFCKIEGKDEYESHFLFPPETRGKRGLSAARRILNVMFTVHGASAILGYPPKENLAVRIFGYRLGFRRTGNVIVDGFERLCPEYKLERSRWAKSSVGL